MTRIALWRGRFNPFRPRSRPPVVVVAPGGFPALFNTGF